MRLTMVAAAISVLFVECSDSRPADAQNDQQAVKKALQVFQEYIGAWNGNGESKTGKTEFWKEGMNWSWKFAKDGSATLHVDFKDGKQFDTGELTFLPDKKKYQFTLTGKDKREQVFLGEFKQKRLILTRAEKQSADKYSLVMFTTNEGALFKMEYAVQTGGKGIDKRLFEVNHKKEGVSLAGGKKNECIVSGGVGTIAVSYGGKTYYVCCGGCRDAFNENPKKFIEESAKKK